MDLDSTRSSRVAAMRWVVSEGVRMREGMRRRKRETQRTKGVGVIDVFTDPSKRLAMRSRIWRRLACHCRAPELVSGSRIRVADEAPVPRPSPSLSKSVNLGAFFFFFFSIVSFFLSFLSFYFLSSAFSSFLLALAISPYSLAPQLSLSTASPLTSSSLSHPPSSLQFGNGAADHRIKVHTFGPYAFLLTPSLDPRIMIQWLQGPESEHQIIL
mmetsp:Transcript_33163/g.59946  ORF Transcript_33163/g.59946 Transcript_33163/m.59946 type:complete len:213 (-) Transcript_33163:721-1359(-)